MAVSDTGLEPVSPGAPGALRSTTNGTRECRAVSAADGPPPSPREARPTLSAGPRSSPRRPRIFREKGFRGASLADVAESLGTDRASLYYYIGSKEELLHEIVRDAAEANAQQAEAIRDGAGTAVDKLGILITALMASYSAHYPYLFVYIQEDLSKVADGRSAWARQMTVIKKRYDDAVIGIVESGFEDGSDPRRRAGPGDRLRPHRHGQLDAPLVPRGSQWHAARGRDRPDVHRDGAERPQLGRDRGGPAGRLAASRARPSRLLDE